MGQKSGDSWAIDLRVFLFFIFPLHTLVDGNLVGNFKFFLCLYRVGFFKFTLFLNQTNTLGLVVIKIGVETLHFHVFHPCQDF